MPITLRDYQQNVVNGVYNSWQNGNRNVALVMGTGLGKCHGRDTPILMFNGEVKKVQDIQAGDFVMGPDSQPRFVVSTTHGFGRLYKITPVKGDSFVVNSEHILSLKRTSKIKNDPEKGKVVNISVKDYLQKNKTFKHIHKQWRTGVDFTNHKVDFDPYMLGLWLGDGSSDNTEITNPEPEIISYCKDFAEKHDMKLRFYQKPNNKAWEISFSKKILGNKKPCYFRKFLKDYNLFKNKHIPLEYKTACREDRLKLLAGILDTDGSLSQNSFDLIFKSEKLLDDTIFLARSLGLACYKTPCLKTCTNTNVTDVYYRCCIQGETSIIPTKVERKKAKKRQQIKDVLVTGFNIEDIGEGDYYGFEVYGNDRLYLLGDFTVTHNSICMSSIALDFKNQHRNVAVIAHRNELVSQMSCHLARAGIVHRVIASKNTVGQITRKHRALFGKSFISPTELTAVVGVDTLISRYESLRAWAQQISLWEVDECFPSGTKITTVDGYKNIEDIKIGDKVLAFDEKTNSFAYKKVTDVFVKKMPESMMSLTLNAHHIIRCTCNHPFWTKRGWVKAEDLTLEDEVLYASDKSSLYPLRKRVYRNTKLEDCKISRNRKRLLFKRVLKRIYEESIFGNNVKNQQEVCLEKNVGEKSYVQRGNEKESFGKFEKNTSQTHSTRWKRKTFAGSRKKTFRNSTTSRICQSMCCKNRSLQGWNLSDLLQNRCRESFIKNRCGSRRPISRESEKKIIGQEKRFVFKWFRLDCIEIQKQICNGKSSGNLVYNIEVDKFHTYVANNIVVHNCHHLTKNNKWGKAVQLFQNAYGLGVTATPNRADGQGLGRWADGYTDDMVIGPSMRWSIEHGFLADYEIVCPKSDLKVDDSEVSANGDWSNQTLRKAAKKSKIVGDVVQNYIKYAPGRQAIVFATDVETADEISKDFNEHGIKAVSLNGNSQAAYREQSLELFAKSEIQVLVNVDLFDEGLDINGCDVVIMARPTASLGKFLQQVGRSLRPAPGKTALIIDHVSNVIRHGLPDMPREWSLDRRQKKAKQVKDPDEIELTVCKNCLKPYEKFRTVCPYCGAEPPLPEPRSRSIEMVEGDLILLDRAALERMRRGTMLEAPGSVAERVAKVAGPIAAKGVANRQIEKIAAQGELKDAIAQWAAIERSRGFNDREIYRRFYLSTGMDVLTALDGSRSRQDYLTTAERVRGWYK